VCGVLFCVMCDICVFASYCSITATGEKRICSLNKIIIKIINISCSDNMLFVATSGLYLPDFKINKRIAITVVHFCVSDIVTITKFTFEKCSRRNIVPFLTFLLK
jgi:hypothetical protein